MADVGACAGEYSMHALPFSARCFLFEPRPDQAESLRSVFMGAASVEQCAISDSVGTVEMRIPANGLARSTIESRNELEYAEDITVIRVPTRRLDSYSQHRFGFIKIDVEGHEEAVLRGADGILRRDHPSLLIEIEERHNRGAIQRIFTLLKSYGYLGLFLHENRLRPIEQFDVSLLQPESNILGGKKLGVYLNNFLFIQPEVRTRLSQWVQPHR